MRSSPIARRTPLGPGAQALERGSTFKPPNRRRHGQPNGRVAWHQETVGKRCVMCGGAASQGHHVITKQALRRHHLMAHLWNLDNHMPLCHRCHGDHHNYSRRIPYDLLSATHRAFAEAVGLGWLLEREYPKEAPSDAA